MSPQASPVPVRLVPVYEETLAPGAADSYPFCPDFSSSSAWAAYSAKTDAAYRKCTLKASYAIGTATSPGSESLPTNPERRQLCACTEFIDVLQNVTVPRCFVYKGGATWHYAKMLSYCFELCTIANQTVVPTPTTTSSGSSSKDVSPVPAPTTSPSPTSSGSSSSSPALIGAILGAAGLVLLAVIIFVVFKRKQAADSNGLRERMVSPANRGTKDRSEGVADIAPSASASVATALTSSDYPPSKTEQQPRGWDDDTLLVRRITYSAIKLGQIISRGGYGEVYVGSYNNQTVAIKQLLPDKRNSVHEINGFFEEAKLLCGIKHERIVEFIGVAWDSPADVCIVLEYMQAGDLRSALGRWEFDPAHRRQHGFDVDKVKIALHIAHALTYLHSCQPVILHRDLKSKNVLLDEECNAKLTDFGVSRERVDYTMTSGIGSSLWMAPEVMTGGHYNEKADIFSFGVVLSELDTHAMPYAQAMDDRTGRRLPDSALLQLVSTGQLTVSFSIDATDGVGCRGVDVDLAILGRACVAHDPSARPSAPEILHEVNQALQRLQNSQSP